MNPDAYELREVDEHLQRAREVITPDGKQRILVSLPADEEMFRRTLPHAEEICNNLPRFLGAFESFKEEQAQQYRERAALTRWHEDSDCAAEIVQLEIERIVCGGGDQFNIAEVSCRNLPGSWRYWYCGYADGQFFDLMF